MDQRSPDANRLGEYLKTRRVRLDPATFGFSQSRRRTPGLRREEVAARANISPTWYTWLEQGRGGAPSADVLDRIARALMLTGVEREHLFVLGLGRPPEARYRGEEGVTPRLQRVLDALEPSAALIRTAIWDVVAWNRAVPVMLTDYGSLPPAERNILRQLFFQPDFRGVYRDWEAAARFIVGAFRADVTRAGAEEEAAPLVADLSRQSPEFAAMWRENDVEGFGGGLKQIRHPVLGQMEFEYSAFSVEGRPDLGMIVYNPVSEQDAATIRTMMEARDRTAEGSGPAA